MRARVSAKRNVAKPERREREQSECGQHKILDYARPVSACECAHNCGVVAAGAWNEFIEHDVPRWNDTERSDAAPVGAT